MYNLNGTIAADFQVSLQNNRAFLYGDAVFETIKVVDNNILFLEDHYFRLMASMRILRMEIPDQFTMEFFENQILELKNAIAPAPSYRIRITVYRDSDGFYYPNSKVVSFLMHVLPLQNKLFQHNNTPLEIELFKDFSINTQLLSTLKSTNRMVQITGSIFAKENGYDNCVVLNTDKNVAEALDSNIFMVVGNHIVTPPLADGCLNGILRKQLIAMLSKTEGYTFEEKSISPFDLQKADELFLTNAIKGIQSVTKYRKKSFDNKVAQALLNKLNLQLI